MDKKITIKDVAKHAGVGTSSISRFYNGGYLSTRTKEKIIIAIEELNYYPSTAALALKGISTELAVVVERINSNTGSRFIQEFTNYADKHFYTTSVYTSGFDDEKRRIIIDKLIKRKVKKIFILPYNDLDYGHNDQIIVIGQKSKYYHSIYYDEQKAIEEILTTYTDKYTSLMLCGYEINDTALARRVEYVARYCQKNNIEYSTTFRTFASNDFLLDIKEDTYYFCMTDMIAHMIYFQAKTEQKTILISGIGNYQLSKYLNITSIDNMYEHVAHIAVDMINSPETKEIIAKAIIR